MPLKMNLGKIFGLTSQHEFFFNSHFLLVLLTVDDLEKKVQEPLPHNTREPGSILTSGVGWVEFACSPSAWMEFPPGSPVYSHVSKMCGFVG